MKNMSEHSTISEVCDSCGHVFADPQGIANQSITDRLPCPECGSTAVSFHLTAADAILLKEQVGIKTKRSAGRRGRLIEGKFGDDLHKATGRWNRLDRRIDYQRDWYDETITDPETGAGIHEVHEPLSEHQLEAVQGTSQESSNGKSAA
jgi:rubredoxin